jgi:hypothetical protein
MTRKAPYPPVVRVYWTFSRVLDIYEIQSHQLNLDRLKVLVVHLAVAFPV